MIVELTALLLLICSCSTNCLGAISGLQYVVVALIVLMLFVDATM